MIGRAVHHYKITSEFLSGKVGTIYRAEDTRAHREVFLLFLPPDDGDPQHAERVARQVNLLSRMKHANIAAVDEVHKTEDGQRFVVLPPSEGETLAERLARGPMDAEEALRVFAQIADATEHFHGAEMVHGHIRPDNVHIEPDGVAMLLYLGSKPLSDNYASPEMRQGGTVDHHTDIYSLGAVLSEMLGSADPSIEPVLAKMTAANARDRYRTVAEAVEALAKARARKKLDQYIAHKRRVTLTLVAVLVALLAIMTWVSMRHRASIDAATHVEQSGA